MGDVLPSAYHYYLKDTLFRINHYIRIKLKFSELFSKDTTVTLPLYLWDKLTDVESLNFLNVYFERQQEIVDNQ